MLLMIIVSGVNGAVYENSKALIRGSGPDHVGTSVIATVRLNLVGKSIQHAEGFSLRH
jgi:hypothetical protein